MFGGSDVTDKALLKAVTQRLTRGAGSSSRVSATVQSGTVTLTGKLQFDAQRGPLLKLVARVPGVRRVNDQLTLAPKAVYPTYVPPAPVPDSAPAAIVPVAEAAPESPPAEAAP
jgi:hypothetical protein